MKQFKSFMKENLNEYIDYRKELGFSTKSSLYCLRNFDQHAQNNNDNWSSFTVAYFLDFRKTIHGKAQTINNTIVVLRNFFQFLVRKGIYEQNPLKDIPAYREGGFIPFIFTQKQTDRLLVVIQKGLRKTSDRFLTDFAVYTAILLMSRCGLRISEPINLQHNNYQSKEGLLHIEKTKFKKNRVLPVPKTVMQEMDNYLAVRKSFNIKSNYLLSTHNNKKLSNPRITRVFHQAVKNIGITQNRFTLADTTFANPTPHSLRHSFAVNTLKRIKEKSKSPQDALHILSDYMGHRKYRYTAVYLKVFDAQHRQGLVDFHTARHEEI